MSSTQNYGSRLQDPQRAREYAARFERGHRRRIGEREQRAVQKIFQGLADCRHVLDVPCGAGRFLQKLAANGREVIEMDLASEVLDLAQERAAALGLQAWFIKASASDTGLPDSSVDAVFCNRLLHHITSPRERAAFLVEFHRITRCYLVISFFDYTAFGSLRVLLKRLKGRKVDYKGQPTVEEFSRELEASGFRVREIVPTGPPWVSQKYFVAQKNQDVPAR